MSRNTPPAKRPPDPVQQASEESFPASDPPAHSGVRTPPPTPKCDPAAEIKPPPRRDTLKPDKVAEASEESFPASDPPAWGTSHA
jgi:hypothetical protein